MANFNDFLNTGPTGCAPLPAQAESGTIKRLIPGISGLSRTSNGGGLPLLESNFIYTSTYYNDADRTIDGIAFRTESSSFQVMSGAPSNFNADSGIGIYKVSETSISLGDIIATVDDLSAFNTQATNYTAAINEVDLPRGWYFISVNTGSGGDSNLRRAVTVAGNTSPDFGLGMTSTNFSTNLNFDNASNNGMKVARGQISGAPPAGFNFMGEPTGVVPIFGVVNA